MFFLAEHYKSARTIWSIKIFCTRIIFVYIGMQDFMIMQNGL